MIIERQIINKVDKSTESVCPNMDGCEWFTAVKVNMRILGERVFKLVITAQTQLVTGQHSVIKITRLPGASRQGLAGIFS
jgi:hypothetical protein